MGIPKIVVYAEAEGDKPATSTLELLTKARELADTVECLYVGTNADALAGSLGEHGASKVHAIDPGDMLPGVVGAAALARLVAADAPDAVLFAQSYDGREMCLAHTLPRRICTVSPAGEPRRRNDALSLPFLLRVRVGER